jgi:hypothetical protein
VCVIEAGPPVGLARAGGKLWVLADSDLGPKAELYSCEAGKAIETTKLVKPDDDPNRVEPSGIWSLGADSALLGDFRRGPSLIDGKGIRLARAGFRGTLTSSVSTAPDGRVILALMSTGVYVGDGDTWEPLVKREGDSSTPVTDAMDVASADGRILVLDFDGLTIGKGSTWYRTEGVKLATGGRRNALVEIAVGPGGAFFARDFEGGLWSGTGRGWEQCATRGVQGLRGEDDNLVALTARGLLRIARCSEEAAPAWPDLDIGDIVSARTDGRWLATAQALFHDGKRLTTLALGPVWALAAKPGGEEGDEVLLAAGDGTVYRCGASGCEPATAALSDTLAAVGWLPDGRIFAAEERGTLLVAEGTGKVGSFTNHTLLDGASSGPGAGRTVADPGAASELAIPPWRGLGRANFGMSGSGVSVPTDLKLPSGDHRTSDVNGDIPGPVKPGADLDTSGLGGSSGDGTDWLLLAEVAGVLALAGVIAWVELRRRKGPRRRSAPKADDRRRSGSRRRR